jgi:DNA-directed RNA polymerase subunit RPC12/RpoP
MANWVRKLAFNVKCKHCKKIVKRTCNNDYFVCPNCERKIINKKDDIE